MYLNNINEVVNDVKVTAGWSWCRRYYRKTSMYFLYVHLTFCLMLTPAKSCKALEPSFEWISSCNCREEEGKVTPCWLLNKEIAGAKKKKKTSFENHWAWRHWLAKVLTCGLDCGILFIVPVHRALRPSSELITRGCRQSSLSKRLSASSHHCSSLQ